MPVSNTQSSDVLNMKLPTVLFSLDNNIWTIMVKIFGGTCSSYTFRVQIPGCKSTPVISRPLFHSRFLSCEWSTYNREVQSISRNGFTYDVSHVFSVYVNMSENVGDQQRTQTCTCACARAHTHTYAYACMRTHTYTLRNRYNVMHPQFGNSTSSTCRENSSVTDGVQ